MSHRIGTAICLGVLSMAGVVRSQATPPVESSSKVSLSLAAQPHSSLHGTWSANGLHWEDDIEDALALFPESDSPFDPWVGIAPPSADVHDNLQSMYTSHGPLEAVRVTASVTTRWASTPAPSQVTVRGVFSAAGRFDVAVQWPGVDPEGFPCILEERVAFDGTILTLMPEGSPEATAWLAGSAEIAQAFRHSAPWARLIMGWLVDPISLSQPEGDSWEVADVGASRRHVSRTDGLTQQILQIDLSEGGVLIDREQRVNGTPFARRTFGAPLSLGDVVRPRAITDTFPFDGAGGAHEVALVIREAELVTIPEGFGRLEPEDGFWFVIP